MGRPPHADGRHTRQLILDAGLELFANHGFFGTSLRDIATAVGVRESALYNYFKSKDELFEAILAAAREHKAERLSTAMAQSISDPRTTLEQVTGILLDHFVDPHQQRIFRVLMCDGVRLAREGRINFVDQMTNASKPFLELMTRLIAEAGLRPRQPELLALEFMAPLVYWRQLHATRSRSQLVIDRQAFVRGHVQHFLQGASPRSEAPSVRTIKKTPATRRTRTRAAS